MAADLTRSTPQAIINMAKPVNKFMKNFPVKFAMSTYYANGNKYISDSAWSNFEWLKKNPTESSAAASAMATGFKTGKRAISYDSLNKPLETIVDKFEKFGKIDRSNFNCTI